ncbi:hypothetical protein GQ600_2178 [Phytophthora cactorum]|nr:hypothetical protein GQ600_2178 [Phytophthora cactorum]
MVGAPPATSAARVDFAEQWGSSSGFKLEYPRASFQESGDIQVGENSCAGGDSARFGGDGARHEGKDGGTVRGLEAKVEDLKADQKASQAPSLLQLEAQEKVEDSSNLCWNDAQTDGFTVTRVNGVIKSRRSGVYNLNVLVNSLPNRSSHQLQLLKNGNCIQVFNYASTRAECISDSLNSFVRVEESDELAVTSDCSLGNTSYLSALRLWN